MYCVLFLSSALPSQNISINLHCTTTVGSDIGIECGIKQGALGEFYAPRWIKDDSELVDVDTVGSRFQINRRILEDFTLIISPVVLEHNGTYYICSVDIMIDGQHHTVESPVITLMVNGEYNNIITKDTICKKIVCIACVTQKSKGRSIWGKC